MLLLDANIPMYVAGRPHRLQPACVALFRRIADGQLTAAVDAETLQEILHRYSAIGRRDEGLALYDHVRVVIPTVIPVTAAIMDETRRLMLVVPGATARDAVHAAVARLHGCTICSYDRDLDRFPGVVRVEP